MAEKILRGPEQKLPKESFGKLLYKCLQKGESRIAQVDAVTGENTTYKEILQRSVSLAQHLKRIGLTKNDSIAISSENSLYFSIPVVSALFLGITLAPLNHLYTLREYVHAMNISKPKLVFCSNAVLGTMLKVTKEIKSVQQIIVINKCDSPPQSVQKLEDFLYYPIPSNFEITDVEEDHVAAILCSSGTTGLPKGVMLTHKGFYAALDYIKHPGYANYHSGRVALTLLPFYHAFGFISHLCMLATNLKMVILPKFEERLFLSAIRDYKVTMASLVPPLVLFLSKSPIVDEYDLSSLKEIVSGAAPLSKEIQDSVVKRLSLKIRQGYGLTELTLAATLQPPYGKEGSGTIGVLIPGMECKVIDLETGKSLGPNQTGEMCFRGPQIMKGYAGDEEATAATIDKDGWLHSGDVGYYDNDGFFYIVDRLKELIKFKGFQVPPAELEAILLKHPQILDCAVVGTPDEDAGELPTAFVIKKPNTKLVESDILKYVKDNVSYHKRLHGGVIFVDYIPRNPTGKILRRILKEKLSTKSKL